MIASALDQRFKYCAVSNDIFPTQDLFCGVLDGEHVGLVTSVERTVEYVFMEALAFPAPDSEDDVGNCPTVKNQLLPGLRSFCSALRG
jgi:dynein heavy chain